MTPLIARAFAAVPCDAWGDGAPLLATAQCNESRGWPRETHAPAAPQREHILSTQGRRVDADARCAAVDAALRDGGMSPAEICDAHGYASEKSMMNSLYTWRARQREEA